MINTLLSKWMYICILNKKMMKMTNDETKMLESCKDLPTNVFCAMGIKEISSK